MLFDPIGRCYTCINKKPQVRQSARQIVNEVGVGAGDQTFEDFFARTQIEISNIVEQYRQSLR